MKNTDKIVIAFLVSAGIFSAGQAVQYTQKASANQKKQLLRTAQAIKNNNIVLVAKKSPLDDPLHRPSC